MAPPRLRPLDATKVVDEGKNYLALRDNEGFTDKIMLLSPLDALIAARLNGRITTEQIAAEVGRQSGMNALPIKRIEELITALDKNYMLESERFRKRREAVLEDFRSAPERPAALAGRSYTAKPKELTKTFDDYFKLKNGPGFAPAQPDGSAPLTGLVVPHLDYPRGKAGYAWSYSEVLRSELADLYVILGVAHSTPPTPLVLTEKDFGTPFGPARIDHELARALAEDAPYNLREDELVHRTEHSIEFQAVYLKYVQQRLGGDFKILPLLASSCDLMGSDPGERTLKVLGNLEALLRDYPGKVCLLAAVDFAHIGPCFGDTLDADAGFLSKVAEQDKISLEHLQAQEPEAFLDSVMSDGNQRRVCGVSALHAFSWLHKRLFPYSKGTPLHYGHAADPAGGEITFASMAFRENRLRRT